MIGGGYWSTGITVRYRKGSGWAAVAPLFDDGFVGDDDISAGIVSTEGELRTRYHLHNESGLAAAIDAVKRDAERLGITFHNHSGQPPGLYYEADGMSQDRPPPEGWREMIGRQAARLGWESPYREKEPRP